MDHDSMVAEVKRLQKEDPVAKEQWAMYCDREKAGVKDPMKHEERSLETFLSSYKDGARISAGFVGGGGGGGGQDSADDWVVVFKEMQRKSEPFRASWSGYCQAMGHGKCDPSKHGKDFLVRFLDQLAASASAISAAAATAHYPPPAAKRPRLAGGGGGGPIVGLVAPKGGGKGMAGGMDGRKHQLVERVKAYQRSGQVEKESWSSHCDEHLGGVKDPARIETSDLQAFIESYGVP